MWIGTSINKTNNFASKNKLLTNHKIKIKVELNFNSSKQKLIKTIKGFFKLGNFLIKLSYLIAS